MIRLTIHRFFDQKHDQIKLALESECFFSKKVNFFPIERKQLKNFMYIYYESLDDDMTTLSHSPDSLINNIIKIIRHTVNFLLIGLHLILYFVEKGLITKFPNNKFLIKKIFGFIMIILLVLHIIHITGLFPVM